MLKKFIFFLAWIGIFILSLIGIIYVVVPKYLVQFNTYVGTFGYDMIILIISIIYFLVCIYKFISLFERTKDYSIKTENGTVYISASTVATFVKQELSSDREISNVKVDTRKSGNKFNVGIKVDITSNENVSDKLSYIQAKIKDDLGRKFGIEVGKVEVKISKLSTNKPYGNYDEEKKD